MGCSSKMLPVNIQINSENYVKKRMRNKRNIYNIGILMTAKSRKLMIGTVQIINITHLRTA